MEIKSTERVTEDDVRPLQHLEKDIANSEAFCLSLDPTVKKVGEVLCFPGGGDSRRLGYKVVLVNIKAEAEKK